MIRTSEFKGKLGVVVDEFYGENMEKTSTRVWLVPESKTRGWLLLDDDAGAHILGWLHREETDPFEVQEIDQK